MNDFASPASSSPTAAAALVPVPTPGSGAAPQSGGPAFGRSLEQLRGFASTPTGQRATLAVAAAGLLLAALLIWNALSAPEQRTLADRLSDADKAAVAQVLDNSGIAYRLDAATGAISVAAGDYHTARMALATAGLPKAAPDGDRVLADLPMGASRAVEGEKLRMAREMDLARTIEAIDAVESARVLLALDAPSAFLRPRSTPTASVMLTLAGGQSLSEGQVRAIVHLVAASVPGMEAGQVSVVDQNGKLLSSDGANSPHSQQLEQTQAVEDRHRRALAALLTPIVGAGNFTAEVAAELKFDQRQQTRESYPVEDRTVRREQGSWSSENGNGTGGYGVPGALSNAAPPAAVPGDQPAQATNPDTGLPLGETVIAGDPRRTSENFERDFQLGREVAVTREATGVVTRLSVAVALRNTNPRRPLTAAEITAIENLVKGAIGFNAERGDQVTVTARSFAATPVPVENWWDAPWVASLVRNGTALLVVLALLIGVGRPLMKRRAAARAEAKAREEALAEQLNQNLTMALAAPHGGDGQKAITLDMITAAPSYAQRAELVRLFVRQNPDHAALVVRDLLAGVPAARGDAAKGDAA